LSYVVVIRSGSQVERRQADTVNEALEIVERAGRALAGAPRRKVVDLRYRTFEPSEQVAHRIELARAGWLKRGLGGIDVRGDGTLQAWTGWTRRRPIDPETNESVYEALRRALTVPC
jgi:hypothetical protein